MLPTASVSQLASARIKWPFFVGAWLLTALLALILGLLSSVASVFAVIIVVAVLFSALALFNYRIGVVLLVLLMPLANTSLFPHEMLGITGLNPFNLLLFLTLLSYFLPRFMKRETYTLFPAYFYGLYLLPVIAAAMLGSRHINEIPFQVGMQEILSFDNVFGYVRDTMIRPLFMVLVAYLLGAAVKESRRPESYLRLGVFAVVALFLTELTILLLYGHGLFILADAKFRGLLSVTGMHANQMGPFFAVAYGAALFMLPAVRMGWPKLITGSVVAMSVIAGVLTFSRGGFVVFTVITLIYFLVNRNLKVIAFGLILIALAAAFAPHEVYDRATAGWGEASTSSNTSNSSDELTAGRFWIWGKVAPDLLDSPLVGKGLNAMLWSEAIKTRQIGFMTHPHNAYLRMLLEFGLIGTVMLFVFFRKIYLGWKEMGQDACLSPQMRAFFAGISVSFIGYAAFAFTSSGVVPEPDQYFFWLAIGMMFGIKARPEMKQPHSHAPVQNVAPQE